MLNPLEYLHVWVQPQQDETADQLAADLEAFDNLPGDLRQATNDFPLRLHSASVQRCLSLFGEQITRASLDYAAKVFVNSEAPERSPIYGKEELL